MARILSFLFVIILFSACSSSRKGSGITQSDALTTLLQHPSLQAAHVGISIYDVGSDSFLVQHQDDKFFVPASNTKIVTCYASMKWLGDSSLTFHVAENDTAVFVKPAGDPSFLHRDFVNQPAFEWLKAQNKPVYFIDQHWKSSHWGNGWAWSDYDASYMAERSPMPVFGNTIRWEQNWTEDPYDGEPAATVSSDPQTEWEVTFSIENPDSSFKITRELAANKFTIYEGKEENPKVELPFVTRGIRSALEVLSLLTEKPMNLLQGAIPQDLQWKPVHTLPIDSLLKPMMNRSDNFFAEQMLLMVSYKMSGTLNEYTAIDSMLKTTLDALPQTPRWADGSGLSRYNLFSPRDFVTILKRMRDDIGMERIKAVFPAGGQGTLSSYYKSEIPYLHAKTGTLSGVVALSGYITGSSGRPYIFSVLVNNHRGSAVEIRRAVEAYLINFRESH